ncbi:SDR family NAD(P)-dependent oxidoreductase [Fibrella aquatilis]|uniref:SDR family oxidoreductase n=1 Tax=Fibrella aquatilis TaxID=2817059 RepID=A0A939G8W7_9BACT|nr:SDR family oxidoreductase [Fibrella aquatilis]MBO0931968.1 SDR family oxidoreductase [Fibrella aquatilis]
MQPQPKSFPNVADKSLANLLSLAGRTAVVTGAARGIGAAIAYRLAEAGANLILADKRTQELDATVQQLSANAANAGRVVAQPTDISQSAQIEQLAERAINEFGKIDIWVNDAGTLQPIVSALNVTDAIWQDVIGTNLSGTFYGCRAAGLRMKERGGVIVNIASSLAFHSVPKQPHYIASKWGVRGLTAALANEWGQYGIRVVAVGPGLTDTPGVEENMDLLDGVNHGDTRQMVSQAMPAGRLGDPDDIARMVLVLASDMAAYATGAEYLVDGGEVYSSPAGR